THASISRRAFLRSVWCFSFRSLFNLQGTRPAVRTITDITTTQDACQELFSSFCSFSFAVFLRAAPLGDSLIRLPHHLTFVNTFFHLFSRY
ncbi:MAG: hypothetical protein IKV99_01785, partial [Oscillospiraceae bacterium]|nr:hypothetical protein [Oscillospiraceae bacterium]